MAIDIMHSLRQSMISNAAVSALTSTRIYTEQAPSGNLFSSAMPQIVLVWEESDRLRHFDGVNDLARVEIVIHTYHDVRSDLVDLMATIRNEYDHLRGTVGSSEPADVRGIFFEEDRIERLEQQDGGEFGFFHGEQDITIRFVETVP